ncbi:MAG: DUF1015 domain-containing protein [Myxococcota bacterium]
MSIVRPFRGVRPNNAIAGEVIAPPYDVLSREEAADIARRYTRSFIRVTRSEIELDETADPHGPEAYQKAQIILSEYLSDGTLHQDENPCFYLYSQSWQGREQHGLMALCATDEYDAGLIKKHELTRPDKEQDRTDHIQTLGAQTGLVFLAYRNDHDPLKKALSSASVLEPVWSVTTSDSVTHTLRVIDDSSLITAIQSAFEAVPALYIADGHHRSAAASRVASLRKHSGSSNLFLAGIFPDDSLKILAYNRLVKDLNGHSTDDFREAVSQHFDLESTDEAVPTKSQEWTMYLRGQWYRMQAKPNVIPEDVVGQLDVSVLQNTVLGPILGIDNPRTNTRISFVGGIRGHQALSSSVDSGEAAVAFHLAPTKMSQLLDVADADRLMPPKSTWFEPKLRGGVLVHLLE